VVTMDRLIRHANDDSGLTLVELLLVCSVMGFVLAAAWSANFAINKAAGINRIQTQAAHDFGDPMELTSKLVMQETSIATAGSPVTNGANPGPYTLTFWTSQYSTATASYTPKLNKIYVTGSSTAAGNLVRETWDYNAAMTTASNHKTFTLVKGTNTNVASSVPLFRYYDVGGNEVTTVGNIASATYKIQATLTVKGFSTTPLTDQRDISLRNKR
jgi:hypothetical protein